MRRGKTRYPQRYEVIFRARSHGKSTPKIGTSPEVGQPGDLVSYFDGGQYTRIIAKVDKGIIQTEPLMDGDKVRKIKFADVYEIMHDHGHLPKPDAEEPPRRTEAEPKPKPAKATRKTRPKAKPKPAKPASTKRRRRKPRAFTPTKENPKPPSDDELDDWLGSLKPDR